MIYNQYRKWVVKHLMPQLLASLTQTSLRSTTNSTTNFLNPLPFFKLTSYLLMSNLLKLLLSISNILRIMELRFRLI